MTDEQEALAMVNEAYGPGHCRASSFNFDLASHRVALRAVQERKAFAQEVSDAVEAYNTLWHKHTPSRDTFMEMLGRFIITQPDPLAEVFRELGWKTESPRGFRPDHLRAALAKHNGRIVFDD